MSRRAYPSLLAPEAAARGGKLFNVVIYPTDVHNIVFAILDGQGTTVSLHIDDLRRIVEAVDRKRENDDGKMVGW